jgi:hypothetical protein
MKKGGGGRGGSKKGGVRANPNKQKDFKVSDHPIVASLAQLLCQPYHTIPTYPSVSATAIDNDGGVVDRKSNVK